MSTTITVRKVWHNPGTSAKTGKPYELTKLLGHDGNYYTTFDHFPLLDELKEGMTILLDVGKEPRKLQKGWQYTIMRVISLQAFSSTMEQAIRPPLVQDTQPAPSIHRIEEASRLLEEAKIITEKEFPEWKEVAEYPALIAEVVHYMGALDIQQRIAAMEVRKLKAYGKE